MGIHRKLLSTFFIITSIFLLGSCGASSSFESSVTSGDYADAIMIYRDKISGNSSKELEAKNFLLDYMQNTLSDYASGQIDDQKAESAYDCLLKLDNELYILNVELGQAIEQYTVLQVSKEKYEQAVSEMGRGSYDEAVNLFASVDESDTQNYKEARQQLQLCNLAIYEKVNSSITKYIADEQYELAISEFEQFCQTHEELVESDLDEKIATCKVSYRNQIIEKSIDLYHNYGAEAADAAIFRGLELLENDVALINVSNLYQSVAEPVSFKYLTGREDGGVGLSGVDKTDSMGESHSSRNMIYCFGLSNSRPTSSIERNTYGSYTVLSGDMFFLDTEYDSAASMKIYADGEVVFDSGPMNKKTGGTHFNIDISGVYSIKIELSYIDLGNVYSPCFLDNVFVSQVLTDEEIRQAALD